MGTKAKERFDSVMQRCDELIAACKSETLQQNICDDVLRSVVVYSVAALDAYVSDRFMEEFTGCLKAKQHPKAIVGLVEKAGVTVPVALSLLSRDKPYMQARQVVAKYFETLSRQSFESIDELYQYLGLKHITKSAIGYSGRKKMAGKIQKMFERRHRIVHEGDYNGKHRLAVIALADVERWAKENRCFVESMEHIITQRFSCKRKKRKDH